MFQTRPNANFTAQTLKGGYMSLHTNFHGIQGTHLFYFPLICFVVRVRTNDFNSDLNPGELTKLEHKTLITFCIFAVSSERNPAYTSAKPPPWIGYLPSRVIFPVRSIGGTKWKTGVIPVDDIWVLLSVA
jgi:hypothetical protein